MRVNCSRLIGVEERDEEGRSSGGWDRSWRLVEVVYHGMIGVEERDERGQLDVPIGVMMWLEHLETQGLRLRAFSFIIPQWFL